MNNRFRCSRTAAGLAILPALFFVSGFAALLYQVFWQRQLGYILGSGAYATATTIAIFFLGLTLGQLAAARHAARSRDPLRAYAWVEVGIAATAALFFALAPLAGAIHPFLFQRLGGVPLLLAAGQALLAALVLLAPAALMGATLPLMAQYIVRRSDELARRVSVLYAANTLGGATGALAAAFALPPNFGLRASYTVAIACNLAVAAAAGLLARNSNPPAPAPAPTATAAAIPNHLYGLAFASGFLALALQVVWTRMFAQVLHNSVYSFAIILVTFLIALALGAAVAHGLSRRPLAPRRTLGWTLFASGAAIATTPFTFWTLTGGLAYVARDAGWLLYLAHVFGLAAAVLFVPCVALGVVFPYTLKLGEQADLGAGAVVGRLASANTVGAIAGSLAAGFLLLPQLGMWSTIRATAIAYLMLAIAVARGSGRERTLLRGAGFALAGLLITVADPTRLPLVKVDSVRGEGVLWLAEGAYGTVAVVARGDDRRIKLDNFYTIGGTGSAANDRRQADLPLLVAAEPNSVFFLGLGTGITAGASMRHPVERVVAAELIPEIATAAERYFRAHTKGFFGDPRVRVVIADGRQYLRGTAEPFDVIISDLFTPWQAGTSSLYTLEHYRSALARLQPGGLFAQWLPLYQLSQQEFAIIARTMLEVFPQVTLWRGEFLPEYPIVALFGHADAAPLAAARLVAAARRLPGMESVPDEVALALVLIFYAGNLTAASELVAASPLNTDDRPLIEYLAPRTQREERAARARWFTGAELIEFHRRLQAAAPAESDPFLAEVPARGHAYVRAGLDLSRTIAYLEAGETRAAQKAFDSFFDAAPIAVYRMFRDHLVRRFPELVGGTTVDEQMERGEETGR